MRQDARDYYWLNNPVTTLLTWQNRIGKITVYIVQSCFNILYRAWQIDRACSCMLEHAKPDLIQQPSMYTWLL